eukprot:COSAG02_NODE_30253_length_554_cov_2.307692_2_plen_65_part_01
MRQSRPPGDSYIDTCIVLPIVPVETRDSGLQLYAVPVQLYSGVGSRESGIIDDSSYPEAGKSMTP